MGSAGGLTGPDSRNPGKIVAILPASCFPPNSNPSDRCSPALLDLVDKLMHEGVHTTQKLVPDTLPPDVPPGTLLFAIECFKISLECEAYEIERLFKIELLGAFSDLKRGKKLEPWAQAWFGNCTGPFTVQIKHLADRRAAIEGFLETLKTWLKDCETLDDYTGETVQKAADRLLGDPLIRALLQAAGKAISIKGLAEYIKDNDKAGEPIGLKFKRPGIGDEVPMDVVWNTASGQFNVDGKAFAVGVAHPQDVAAMRDSSARDWLLVAGNLNPAGGGVVRALRVEVVGTDLIIRESYNLVDAGNALGCVSSVVVREDGRAFAMSRAPRSILALVDSTGDGIPDSVGAPAVQFADPAALDDFLTLRASGNDLLVWQRAVFESIGNTSFLGLRDQNLDGFYEFTSVPSLSASHFRAPAWLGDPVAGAISVGLAGAHGHQVVVVSQQGQQILGQATIPAFPDDEVIIDLNRPLQAGETIFVRDLTSQLLSPPRDVGTRAPVIYQVNPFGAVPKTESEIFLRGSGLELVSRVSVGGKKATILQQGPESMTIRTADLKDEPPWEIEFELNDGSSVASPVRLFKSN
jgi:hypothetical protein